MIGSSYTFDVSIAQLEVIYNGQQVRTVREHTMTFPNFALTVRRRAPQRRVPATTRRRPPEGPTPRRTSRRRAMPSGASSEQEEVVMSPADLEGTLNGETVRFVKR